MSKERKRLAELLAEERAVLIERFIDAIDGALNANKYGDGLKSIPLMKLRAACEAVLANLPTNEAEAEFVRRILGDLPTYDECNANPRLRYFVAEVYDWPIIKAALEAMAATGQPAGDDAGATANVTGPTGKVTGSKPRMTVDEANEKAMKLARKMRQGFLALSEREQAKLIGCSWATWKKTPFHVEAQAKRPTKKPKTPTSPKAESLTAEREAVTGEGSRDEILHQLIADQEADSEPSPVEGDRPGRHRKIHSRKRL